MTLFKSLRYFCSTQVFLFNSDPLCAGLSPVSHRSYRLSSRGSERPGYSIGSTIWPGTPSCSSNARISRVCIHSPEESPILHSTLSPSGSGIVRGGCMEKLIRRGVFPLFFFVLVSLWWKSWNCSRLVFVL